MSIHEKKSIILILRRRIYVLQHITKPPLRIFIQHLTCSKQGVHLYCTLTGIQVTTEQIRLLTHHHVTDQALGIIVIQRHIWDVYIISQLIIDGFTFFLTKDYPLTLLSKYHSDKRGYLFGLSFSFLSTSDSRISFASLSPITTSANFGLLLNASYLVP